MQKYSSKMTSVNTSKAPVVWKKLNLTLFKDHVNVVDYGAGRKATSEKVYLLLATLFEAQGTKLNYFPYDPYWQEEGVNRNAISCLTYHGTCDLCVCANVLNVVDYDTIVSIIKEVTKAKNWIFQIYEGDRTGEGKETKFDCFQQNKLTKDYVWIFNETLRETGFRGQYFVKGNFITNNLNLLK